MVQHMLFHVRTNTIKSKFSSFVMRKIAETSIETHNTKYHKRNPRDLNSTPKCDCINGIFTDCQQHLWETQGIERKMKKKKLNYVNVLSLLPHIVLWKHTESERVLSLSSQKEWEQRLHWTKEKYKRI